MTDSDDPTATLDPVKREALEWVIRLTSGAATEVDKEALARWRARSAAHEAAFLEAATLRHALRRAGQELIDEERASAAALPQVPRKAKFAERRLILGGMLAASLAGWMIVRPPLGLWPSFAELTADYRTGTGQRRRVALADGVSVEMNTETSLVVRSGAPDARVELISGEAAVVAERGSADPVTVIAAGGRTIATQATFDVRYDHPSVCVTCLQGTLRIEAAGAVALIEPRQQVTYGPRGLGEVTAADPALVASWRQGLLVFRNEPLSSVVREVNRYRPGKIILANGGLAHLPVNGVFRLDRIDGVIHQIAKLGAHVTPLPGGIVILD